MSSPARRQRLGHAQSQPGRPRPRPAAARRRPRPGRRRCWDHVIRRRVMAALCNAGNRDRGIIVRRRRAAAGDSENQRPAGGAGGPRKVRAPRDSADRKDRGPGHRDGTAGPKEEGGRLSLPDSQQRYRVMWPAGGSARLGKLESSVSRRRL